MEVRSLRRGLGWIRSDKIQDKGGRKGVRNNAHITGEMEGLTSFRLNSRLINPTDFQDGFCAVEELK